MIVPRFLFLYKMNIIWLWRLFIHKWIVFNIRYASHVLTMKWVEVFPEFIYSGDNWFGKCLRCILYRFQFNVMDILFFGAFGLAFVVAFAWETERHSVASGNVTRKAHECKQYKDNMNRKTYLCTRTYIKNHETNKCLNLIDGTNEMTNNNSIFVTIKKIHLNNKMNNSNNFKSFWQNWYMLVVCLWVWIILCDMHELRGRRASAQHIWTL